MTEVCIRLLQAKDIPMVLPLMWDLAVFEGYDHKFKVTEQELLQRGFGPNAEFDCVTAWLGDQIIGYSVIVYTTFTYDLTPAATMKEFLIKEGFRGRSIGQKLFEFTEAHCKKKGVKRLSWLVLEDNHKAQPFYQKMGGEESQQWLYYGKSLY